MTLAERKRRARAEALARRDATFAKGHPAPAALLAEVLAPHRGLPLSGFLAMGSEIDPGPALAAHVAHGGPLGLPVMADGKGRPLRFRLWTPGAPLVPGGFGTSVPAEGDWMEPRVLVVPLVAFDRQGNRLGYGGGFYDRTLARLRAREAELGPVTAIGFAWGAQEAADLPLEPTDAPLDLIVTEAEVIRVGRVPDLAPCAPAT